MLYTIFLVRRDTDTGNYEWRVAQAVITRALLQKYIDKWAQYKENAENLKQLSTLGLYGIVDDLYSYNSDNANRYYHTIVRIK